MVVSKIKYLMEQQEISVRKMCDLTGLSLQTVVRARDARISTCTVGVLETIARALGCQVKDLFEEDGPPGE